VRYVSVLLCRGRNNPYVTCAYSGFRFVWIGTKRPDCTARTARALGEANTPAVVLEEMAEPYALLFRHQRREIELDLVRIRVLCECESLRETHDMGVDADGLLPESVAEDDIGCFPSHTGKREQIVQFVGDFALEALDDFAAAIMDRLCFIAVEIDFVDFTFQLRRRGLGVVFRGSVFFEKVDSHPVDEIVPGLRCQDQRDEQLQGIVKIQVELGVRMDLFQPLDNLLNLNFFPSA
jgi:hypothetical protein